MSMDDIRTPEELKAEYERERAAWEAKGGTAFPVGGPLGIPSSLGMSLRDYFAAKALPSVYAEAVHVGHVDQQSIAAEAYELADAMLEARKRRPDGEAVPS